MADHLVVLDKGSVKVSGLAQDLLARVEGPAIVGEDAGVVLRGKVVQRDAVWHLAQIEFPGGLIWARDVGMVLGKPVRLRVLARDISITAHETRDTSIQNHIQGQIEAIADDSHPSQALVRIRCGESILLGRVTKRAIDALNVGVGDAIWAQVKSVAVIE